MRQLIVMRHAKSDWNTDAATDHDRPLNHRGRNDAPRVARRICELGWTPSFVVSSDSQRTQETYQLMGDEFRTSLGEEPNVQFLESLYHASTGSLTSALMDVPNEMNPVMAIGHNPGWEQVVYWLSGEAIRMTTANAALLKIEVESWPEALDRAGDWTLEDVIRPKEL